MKNSRVILTIVIASVAAILLLAGIYFFVFTSTMSSETAMKLARPESDPAQKDSIRLLTPRFDSADNQTDYPADAFYLLLVNQEKVFVYEDKNIGRGQWISYAEVREYLNKKQKTNPDVFVVIVPFEGASYKNTVDILDEMTINDIKKYYIADPQDKQISFVGQHH